MVRKSILNQLKEFKINTNKELPIKKMIFFGSRAWGRPNRHSDIDLIIVSPKFRKKRWLNRSPQLYLNWNLDYPVDFLCYTPEEFERKKKLTGIAREAVERGIEIK